MDAADSYTSISQSCRTESVSETEDIAVNQGQGNEEINEEGLEIFFEIEDRAASQGNDVDIA